MIPNYRLPKQCCSNCEHSYQNSYGSNQCTQAMGIEIDAGAVCDLWKSPLSSDVTTDSMVIVSPLDVYEQTQEDNGTRVQCCQNCAHSYYSPDGDVPYCDVDIVPIKDINDYCNAYEE